MLRWAGRAVAGALVVVALFASYLGGASSDSKPSSPPPPKSPMPLTPSSRQLEGKLSPQQRQAVQALGAMPVLFVENKGQWDSTVRYAVTGKAVNVALLDSGIKFQLVRPRVESTDAKNAAQDVLTFSLAFEGAKIVQPKGVDEAASKMRFYRGSDPSKWQNAVPTFKSAVYEGLYEGVDLSVRPGPSGIKYEFHVAPKTPAERIVIKYDGVDGLTIDSSGNLRIKTAFGELADAAPSAWQESGGARKDVKISFKLMGDRSYGFEIKSPVDPTIPLIIDPAISWSVENGSLKVTGRPAATEKIHLTAETQRRRDNLFQLINRHTAPLSSGLLSGIRGCWREATMGKSALSPAWAPSRVGTSSAHPTLIIDPAISRNAPCEPVSPASTSPRSLTCRRH